MILTPLQKLPKNEEDWGKLIVAKGFKKLPQVQNITQSGHTGCLLCLHCHKHNSLPLWPIQSSYTSTKELHAHALIEVRQVGRP